MHVAAADPTALASTRAASNVAIEPARPPAHPVAVDLGFSFRVWRLRRQMCRWFYPSERAIRFGGAKGLDELFRRILLEQYRLELATDLPAEIAVTELAGARTDMLPRALARRNVFLAVEQNVIATLHRLLARGDYDVCQWVRVHCQRRSSWVRRALDRLFRWRKRTQDPVDRLRTDPQAFSAFVWSEFWALPELEETLAHAMPSGEPATTADDGLDADAVTTAVHVATKLDTDHAGWAEPARLLSELHSQMRSARLLMPAHPMVRHVQDRVVRAVNRFGDFEPAYEVGTSQVPPPAFVRAALDAFDASDVRHHGVNEIARIVRRIAARLWVTGDHPMPELASASSPPSTMQEPPAPVAPASGHTLRVVPDDLEVGF